MIRKNFIHYLGFVLLLAKLVNPDNLEQIKWFYIIITFVVAYGYGAIALIIENDVAKKLINNEVEKLLIDIVTKKEIKKRKNKSNIK